MANGNKVEVKRQIKWLLKFLLCLILLFNLTRCYYNAPIGYIIKPDDISQITVRSGTTGKTYEISKASQVDEFVEAISEYQMIIYTTPIQRDGWSYHMTFYFKGGGSYSLVFGNGYTCVSGTAKYLPVGNFAMVNDLENFVQTVETFLEKLSII